MTLKDKVLKHGEGLADDYETVVAVNESWCERYFDYNKGFQAAVELLWPLVKEGQSKSCWGCSEKLAELEKAVESE